MSKMAKITYAGFGMHAQKGQKHIVIFFRTRLHKGSYSLFNSGRIKTEWNSRFSTGGICI